MGSIHVTQPVGKPDVKDKTCFNCGKKGHLAENCPEPKKWSHCGKKGHLAKDCCEKHPDKKPMAKLKARVQPTKLGGRGKGRGKGGRKTKEEERETSFVGLMVKKNKMTKNMMTNMKRNNRSNRPGDDMKDELRTDGDPIAWRIWSTAQNHMAVTPASSTLRVSR